MPPRVAIGNNKGGTGKTASTVNLAAALAEAGRRVLVVDLDPQANASRRLGVRFSEAEPIPTVSEAIEAGGRTSGAAAAAITDIAWPELYAEHIALIPARFDLENRVSEAGVLGAVARLRTALAAADDEFELTLIDCPPSLGHLTQLGLAAASHAVTTVQPEYDAVEGALRFADFVADHATTLGAPRLRLAGVLVGQVRSQLGAHSFQLDGLPALFDDGLVWSPTVPERVVVKEAADGAVPLSADSSVRATGVAEVYAELAERLWTEVQH